MRGVQLPFIHARLQVCRNSSHQKPSTQTHARISVLDSSSRRGRRGETQVRIPTSAPQPPPSKKKRMVNTVDLPFFFSLAHGRPHTFLFAIEGSSTSLFALSCSLCLSAVCLVLLSIPIRLLHLPCAVVSALPFLPLRLHSCVSLLFYSPPSLSLSTSFPNKQTKRIFSVFS